MLSISGRSVFSIEIQSSISAYYYAGMRGIFVGFPWTIGVFLFSYEGPEPDKDGVIAFESSVELEGLTTAKLSGSASSPYQASETT